MKTFKNKKLCDGFSLVEVALALGITAFCLTSILGLLPVGLTINQTSAEQTASANIARTIISDFRTAVSGSLTTSPFYQFDLSNISTTPQTLYFSADGSPSGAVGDSATTTGTVARYRAAVAFITPSYNANRTTCVRLVISWPAMADKTANSWPTNAAGKYEVVTALEKAQ
jgi:uncharacterized protein (TIGR02598 family)